MPKPVNRKDPVVMVYGFWGQNIGNAFFNVGGHWILSEIFGEENVLRFQDQPGYRTFHRQDKGNPPKDAQLLSHVRARCIVLQGPMLTTTFESLWAPAFRSYRERGVKVILLGAALFRFTDEEISAAVSCLRRYPVDIIVTRDQETFDALESANVCAHLYSGVDSAFYAPEAVNPVPLDLPPYFTFTFDRFPEPTIAIDEKTPASPRSFNYLQHQWTLYDASVQKRFANFGKWQAYLGHTLDRRELPDRLLDHLILRGEHRFNPHIPWKVYQHPNAFASDEPYTYLAVYAQTDLTLSDRVHACVATLAYGRPAMLFTESPRSRLFDRLHLGQIREKPVELDLAYLAKEKAMELDFLRSAADDLQLR
jgi:hypothetical protein